jgi:DNA-directed RNA polymerase subunit L
MKLNITERTNTRLIVVLDDADHTVGNMVASFLRKNKGVVFAGYEKPHPQVKNIKIQIDVVDGINPLEVLQDTLKVLQNTLTEIKNTFNHLF